MSVCITLGKGKLCTLLSVIECSQACCYACLISLNQMNCYVSCGSRRTSLPMLSFVLTKLARVVSQILNEWYLGSLS